MKFWWEYYSEENKIEEIKTTVAQIALLGQHTESLDLEQAQKAVRVKKWGAPLPYVAQQRQNCYWFHKQAIHTRYSLSHLQPEFFLLEKVTNSVSFDMLKYAMHWRLFAQGLVTISYSIVSERIMQAPWRQSVSKKPLIILYVCCDTDTKITKLY